MLKVGSAVLMKPLTLLFNRVLEERKIPREWAESDIILLYKKGNPCDIGNYRPISLQPCLYKLLASCLEQRLSEITETYQPVEQAGFRKSFSTTDHIHALDQIIEKFQSHMRPLYLAFIDYVKAFDSISHESMWLALQENNTPVELIELIQDIYSKSTSRVKLDRKGAEIKICRGVRQGDPMSPRIFIIVLQSIMKTLDWSKNGICINGSYLSNLRFADDIVLFSETAFGLETMINELNYASLRIGLELNTTKTKVMTNSVERPIHVQDNIIEYVQDYIYLGKQMSFKKSRHKDELERRVKLTWNKFWAYKHILKSDLPIFLKTKIMDSCLLPCLTYASQTWIFNKYTRSKIQTTQRAMERSIIGLRRVHKTRNTAIRLKTKAIDALKHSMKLKWKWAGHVTRYADKRWTKAVTEWQGPIGKRRRGRPTESWDKEIQKIGGFNWAQIAEKREQWKSLEEAFTH